MKKKKMSKAIEKINKLTVKIKDYEIRIDIGNLCMQTKIMTRTK